MKFFLFLIVLGTVVLPSTAKAVSWFPIGIDDSDSMWSYDADSIQRAGHAASINVGVKWKNGNTAFTKLVVWCNTAEYTLVDGTEYDPSGNPVRTYKPIPGIDSGKPFMIPKDMRNRLCRAVCQ
ncbi:MAG: hypothetical protein ABSC19_10305 [Syntrophorhabdales bacterium]|jgi:hypothetical protein